jgi:hypothetical protein
MKEVETLGPPFRDAERLNPDVRAALFAAIPVILLEALTDLVPVAGFLIALPLSIGVYLLQGSLVSRYAHADPRYADASQGQVIGLAARSALWTGAVISPLAALVSLLVGTTTTAGLLLLWLPGVVAGTVLDLLINLGFTMLGSWLGLRATGKQAISNSCLGVAAGVAMIWLLVAVLTVVGILAVVPHG